MEEMILDVTTIEDAVAKGSEKWGIPAGDVVTSVLKEEKRLFGLLGRQLQVKVSPRLSLFKLQTRRLLTEIISRMGVSAEIADMNEEGVVNIHGENIDDVVIGRNGEALKALEYILNLMFDPSDKEKWIIVDANGYRKKRIEFLEQMAVEAAKAAKTKKQPIRLRPMLSWERRIVHMALKEDPEIETRSRGDEPRRQVTVFPKGVKREKTSRKPDDNSPRQRYTRTTTK